MANEEHLAILRQGVEAWNAWRKENPDIRPDLGGADLGGADLGGADLGGADLHEADLGRADLHEADLRGADLRWANLRGACLRGADLRGADLRWAFIRWADLRGADLRGACLHGVYPRWADLRGADLGGADLREADLRGAYLDRANSLPSLESRPAPAEPALESRRQVGVWDRVAGGVGTAAMVVSRTVAGVVTTVAAAGVRTAARIIAVLRGDGGTRVTMPAAVHASPRAIAEPAAPDAQPVDAAVFCPPRVAKGSIFLVQVFLYPPGAEHEAAVQAREADEAAERRGTYSLPLDLPLGTRVDVRLEMPDLVVAEPDAILVWCGRPAVNQFEVAVPAGTPGADAIGRVRFAVGRIPVGTLCFKLKLGAADTMAAATALREAEAVRYRRAFVSYSSQDRAEVLRRVQAFRIAGLSVFQDVLDLEPGERWERALYREIDVCDVFLLFWSHAAAASEWVAKEISYVLTLKAGSDDRPPAIQPVPIEGPPVPPPPETLRHLHFNDGLLAQIQAAAPSRSASAPTP